MDFKTQRIFAMDFKTQRIFAQETIIKKKLKYANTEKEVWTYEELDDIIYGFIITANDIISCECCDGFIELKNKEGYSE